MALFSSSIPKSRHVLHGLHPFHQINPRLFWMSHRTFTSTNRGLSSRHSSESESSKETVKAVSMWPNPIHHNIHLEEKIHVAHRPPKDWADWTALKMVRFLRWSTDLATGYKHENTETYSMNEEKWLTRFVFLESVAGVPGMVAGMLRHLHSLRRLKKDNGWIETLLEEAYNERMHLLTFLSMARPGWIMKIMIIGAQGVFFNSLFIAYLISPRTCHRFVAYLEEEAVLTYSLAIQDIEQGKIPAWEKLKAPDIAIKYWKMPEGEQMMRDLLLRVRADEAKHREVNHTLGNLDQNEDYNPFNGMFFDSSKEQYPSKGIENIRSTGWEREEVIR